MSDHSLGELDRVDTTEDPVGVRGLAEIALVDPQLRPEPVGITTAVGRMVTMGEQDVSHRTERFISRRA